MTIALGVLELGIRDGRLRTGIPVDQARSAIDQSFPIELYEDASHRRRERFVHRKARPLPVRAESEAAKLLLDLAAVRARPLPGALDESLATKVLAAQPFAR